RLRHGADTASKLLPPASDFQQFQGDGADRQYGPDRSATAHSAKRHQRADAETGRPPFLGHGGLEGALQAESRQDEERTSLRHRRRPEDAEPHRVAQDSLVPGEEDVRARQVPDRLGDRRHQRPRRAGSRTPGRSGSDQIGAGASIALSRGNGKSEGRLRPPFFFRQTSNVKRQTSNVKPRTRGYVSRFTFHV